MIDHRLVGNTMRTTGVEKRKQSFLENRMRSFRLFLLNSRDEIFNNLVLGRLRRPLIRDKTQTLDRILSSKCSICRFGDGEFKVMMGKSIRFQESSDALTLRLKEIIRSSHDGLLIAIPNVFSSLSAYKERSKMHWRKFLRQHRRTIYKFLDFNKVYYDTMVSRPYITYKDSSPVKDHFAGFKMLWDNKDVVLIEGLKSRVGLGNDLLSNAKSVRRILCPPENAFRSYDKILSAATAIDKSCLLLIALGPTATVLAYDLFLKGYRAMDFGHLDIEYDWFLQGADEKIPIKHKYVKEVRFIPGDEPMSDDYKSQILQVIT